MPIIRGVDLASELQGIAPIHLEILLHYHTKGDDIKVPTRYCEELCKIGLLRFINRSVEYEITKFGSHIITKVMQYYINLCTAFD